MKNLLVLLFLAIFLFLPSDTYACACCVDSGYYDLTKVALNQTIIDEIDNLELHSTRIYANAGYPDNIEGINPVDLEYQVNPLFYRDFWNFGFTDSNGNNGIIELDLPKEFEVFGVDLRDSENDEQIEIYKEWRFKGKLRNVEGIFEDSSKKSDYFLVFQGRGNACTSAKDFKSWRLEIDGKDTKFAFYGDLSTKNETPKPSNSEGLIVGELTNEILDQGCKSFYLDSDNIKHFVSWASKEDAPFGESLIVNINKKDTKFDLVNRASRPIVAELGEKYTDEYQADGTRVIVEYKVTKLPTEIDLLTEFDVTLTVVGTFAARVLELKASCDN